MSLYPGKRLTTIEQVDEALHLAETARSNSETDFLNVLRTFWMDFPPVTGDPWSPEYAKHWDAVYLFLHGKSYHQNNEFYDFDVDYYSINPYPFCTQDPAVVSKHFIAISHIVGSLNLPPKSKVLEMGAGWGNTSLMLAQMGHDVTVLDMNKKYGELLSNRATKLSVNIDFLCIDYEELNNIKNTYDCILFFESFHHSKNHLLLLDTLKTKLNPEGILALAGEPINEDLPFDWGLNPAGEALWQIRTHGWFELVFRESYLLNTLQNKGYSVKKLELINNPAGTTYICKPTEN